MSKHPHVAHALKVLTTPAGRRIKLGRRAPRIHTPRRKLSEYLAGLSITLPSSTSYRAHGDRALRNIDGNDNLGDCVPAGIAHILGLVTANAGAEYDETQKQVIADYSAIGGYVPGDPNTDQGCDEETALNYLVTHGFANGTKAAGYLAVDASNPTEVRTAIYLFEHVMYGVGLPDAWISPFPSGDGFTWDVAGAADDQNGHCFVGIDYSTNGVIIDTWGIEGTVTDKANAAYATAKAGGQMFVILTPDIVNRALAKAPNGLSWHDLVADFDALGGKVPVPAPPAPGPTPTPTPGPAGAVTLDQATGWVTAGLKAAPAAMPRATAIKIATKALQTNWPVGK